MKGNIIVFICFAAIFVCVEVALYTQPIKFHLSCVFMEKEKRNWNASTWAQMNTSIFSMYVEVCLFLHIFFVCLSFYWEWRLTTILHSAQALRTHILVSRIVTQRRNVTSSLHSQLKLRARSKLVLTFVSPTAIVPMKRNSNVGTRGQKWHPYCYKFGKFSWNMIQIQ